MLDQCYEKGCKKGWTEVGLLCKKNGITPETKQRKSYKRDSGQPARCKLGESFGPNALEDNGNRDFTVVMASDVQLPWGSCTDQKNSDEGVKCAIKENYRLVQGIHEVQERLEWKVGPKDQVNKPLGVFIAGDLTSYGRPWQFNLYRQIWETRKKESKDKNIKLGVWPSLGNHDYFNNVQSCHDFALREEETWGPYLSQSCAQRMVAYIRASVAGCGGKTVNPNFGGHVDHYEKKSAGYAVKYGRIRFAVLHNYPTYRREELVGVASTMGFLEDQIALAEQNDEYLVLVMHDGTNHFGYQHWFKQVERYDYYSKVMTGSRTIAVFQGHLHPQGGMKEYVRDSRERTDGQTSNTPIYNAWGEPIPLVLNWAAEYERFILTQFNIAECYWRYGSVWVGHDERQTEFFEPSYSRHQQIFVLPNCTVDPNYTWSPPTTTVFEGQGEISSARWSFNSLAALASLVVVWAFFGV